MQAGAYQVRSAGNSVEVGNTVAIAMKAAVAADQWTTDQAAENLFERLGVTWEYARGISIGLVDRDLSIQNQARLGVSLIADVVDEYALAMLEGAAFPALVAFPLPNGTYVLAGGNHRLAAAREAKRPLVDLYILRVNDEAMRRLITTSLNTLVGVRPERAETLEQAIAWMERYGRTSKVAAAFYGIPDSTITAEMRSRSAKRRLQLAGVPASSIARTHLERLAQIQNDIVLRDVATFQSEVQLPEKDLKTLVREVREQRTESGQLAVVQQWRDRDDLKLRRAEVSKGRPSPVVKARAELFRTLKSAQNLLGRYVSRGQLGLTNDDDYAKAVELAREVAQKLEAIGGTPR